MAILNRFQHKIQNSEYLAIGHPSLFLFVQSLKRWSLVLRPALGRGTTYSIFSLKITSALNTFKYQELLKARETFLHLTSSFVLHSFMTVKEWGRQTFLQLFSVVLCFFICFCLFLLRAGKESSGLEKEGWLALLKHHFFKRNTCSFWKNQKEKIRKV